MFGSGIVKSKLLLGYEIKLKLETEAFYSQLTVVVCQNLITKAKMGKSCIKSASLNYKHKHRCCINFN